MLTAMVLAVASLGLSGCGTAKSAATAPAPQSASQTVPVPAVPDYSNYLTIADVEKVSGISGIKLVPKNPSIGAGGDLNFATADEKLVVMAGFHGASMYQKYSPEMIHSTLKGFGEEAFIDRSKEPATFLSFAKISIRLRSIVISNLTENPGKRC